MWYESGFEETERTARNRIQAYSGSCQQVDVLAVFRGLHWGGG